MLMIEVGMIVNCLNLIYFQIKIEKKAELYFGDMYLGKNIRLCSKCEQPESECTCLKRIVKRVATANLISIGTIALIMMKLLFHCTSPNIGK